MRGETLSIGAMQAGKESSARSAANSAFRSTRPSQLEGPVRNTASLINKFAITSATENQRTTLGIRKDREVGKNVPPRFTLPSQSGRSPEQSGIGRKRSLPDSRVVHITASRFTIPTEGVTIKTDTKRVQTRKTDLVGKGSLRDIPFSGNKGTEVNSTSKPVEIVNFGKMKV